MAIRISKRIERNERIERLKKARNAWKDRKTRKARSTQKPRKAQKTPLHSKSYWIINWNRQHTYDAKQWLFSTIFAWNYLKRSEGGRRLTEHWSVFNSFFCNVGYFFLLTFELANCWETSIEIIAIRSGSALLSGYLGKSGHLPR